MERRLFIRKIAKLADEIHFYFGYIVFSIALLSQLFALTVLFFRRRTEKTAMIYLFKWQYAIGTIYLLNIAFNNNKFTLLMWGYDLIENIPDIGCRMLNFLGKFINCLPPWMQVVSLFLL